MSQICRRRRKRETQDDCQRCSFLYFLCRPDREGEGGWDKEVKGKKVDGDGLNKS